MELSNIRMIGFGGDDADWKWMRMYPNLLEAIEDAKNDRKGEQYGKQDEANLLVETDSGTFVIKRDLTGVIGRVLIEIFIKAKAEILKCGFPHEDLIDLAIAWWKERQNPITPRGKDAYDRIQKVLAKWEDEQCLARAAGFPDEVQYPFVNLFKILHGDGKALLQQYTKSCRYQKRGGLIDELSEMLDAELAKEVENLG